MQTKIYVEGMTCRHCEMSITDAVSALAGVGQVEVDLVNGTVTVAHGENVSAEMITAEIEKIGFEAHD